MCQSLQGFSYLLTNISKMIKGILSDNVSIPSRVLISSNLILTLLKRQLCSCQSLQGFSYLLTLSLQSRYLSMLIHHFAGQIYFSLYLPITTYAKMSFSPVFMLCAADFTKYASIMFSMFANNYIIHYASTFSNCMSFVLLTVLLSHTCFNIYFLFFHTFFLNIFLGSSSIPGIPFFPQ